MTTESIRPTTLAGIKRLARRIKHERGISHAHALDAAAQSGDFENFKHAQNVLRPPKDPASIPSMKPGLVAPTSEPAFAPAAPSQAPHRRSFNSMYSDNLRKRIEETEEQLAVLRDGRIKGMGYGTGLSDPRSVVIEILRLERNLKENRALFQMDRAKCRLEQAHQSVFKDLLPDGNGAPSFEAVAELDTANENFKRRRLS